MPAVELEIQGLTWCWRHGHPIVGLWAGQEETFWVTLSPDDARALSPLDELYQTFEGS